MAHAHARGGGAAPEQRHQQPPSGEVALFVVVVSFSSAQKNVIISVYMYVSLFRYSCVGFRVLMSV